MAHPGQPEPPPKGRASPRLETEVFYPSPFTLVGRLRSFGHAARGIWLVLKSQHNAWLHAVATVPGLVLAGALHWRVQAFSKAECSSNVPLGTRSR